MNIGDILKIVTERSSNSLSGFQFRVVSTRSERTIRGRDWYQLQCSRCGTRGTVTIDNSVIDADFRRREFWLMASDRPDIEAWIRGHRRECLIRFGNSVLQTSPPVSVTSTVLPTSQTAPLRPRAVFPEGVETGTSRARQSMINTAKEAAKRVKVKRRERVRQKHNVEIIENDIRMIRND